MIGQKKRDNIAMIGMKKRNPCIIGAKKRSLIAVSPMGAVGDHKIAPAQQRSVLERSTRTGHDLGRYA